MLGVRRESVSRAIHEFEAERLAHFSDRTVVILEPDQLSAIFTYRRSS